MNHIVIIGFMGSGKTRVGKRLAKDFNLPFVDVDRVVSKKMNLTMKEILKLGLDLCDGLQACRKKGVIHRDIKPANIFISEFGEYKLGDFGISKQLEHSLWTVMLCVGLN